MPEKTIKKNTEGTADITLVIDNKKIKAKNGQTILSIAKEKGIKIPSLCFHPDIPAGASCRLCLIEIKGKKELYTACNTKAWQGMEIKTSSPKIKKARRINLELLFSQHREECDDCVWGFDCYLLKLAEEYNVKINKYLDRKANYPTYKFSPSLIFDSSKCIDCRNCIDVCKVGFLKIKGRGHLFKILPAKDKECIYCGQCIVHCPAGAFEGMGEFESAHKPIFPKNKVLFFQIAPSIRASVGASIGQIAAALKKLGGDSVKQQAVYGAGKVFDVCVGADITTIEEAKELLERMKVKKNLPLLTSCCSAWVRFVEIYRPHLIPNLTTVRSPHIISGGIIKKYFALKENIDINKIFLISIMPCVAKKYEITRKELMVEQTRPVDSVITTREFLRIIEKHKINLSKLAPQKLDLPFAEPSGAGVIYGASGGVMESALRTAYKEITGKDLKEMNFKQVRGIKGVKECVLSIGSKKVRVAVVQGIDNFMKIEKNLSDYDYIEVMACPGGCIGGGGQPIPIDNEIRKQRASGLYALAQKKKIRFAHNNNSVKRIYKEILSNKKTISKFCHTRYFSGKKP